eukprot:TRINITY_DN1017_c0_g1_i1.p1 TRINITY_DN1017_c0_g1~~TRINITY_DN1017_c0_g1_i1.p1  ORF type:complete len:304 (-),score=37.45 TRINITY_DN1017_c0_g1_i1:225-1136(-)
MLPAPAPPLTPLTALHLSPSPFSTTNRRPRTRVSKACSHCQKSHLSCDHGRPCARCIKKGTSATCVDGVQKKRGKKPRQWYLDQGLEPPARVTRKPSVKRQLAAASKNPLLGSLTQAQIAQSRLASPMMLANGAMFYPAPYLYSPFMPPPDIASRQISTPFLMGSAPPFLQATPTTPTESPYNSPENTEDESIVGKKHLSQDERGAADILSTFTRNPQSATPVAQAPSRMMSSPYTVPASSMGMMRPPFPGMQYPNSYPPPQVPNMYNPSGPGFSPIPAPGNQGYAMSAMANPQMYGIPMRNS